jgi:hypothetical protein
MTIKIVISLWRRIEIKGVTAQRHKGTKAQRYNGTTEK